MTQSDREFHIFEVDTGRSSGIFRLGVAIGEGILGLDRKDQWASQGAVCQILDGKIKQMTEKCRTTVCMSECDLIRPVQQAYRSPPADIAALPGADLFHLFPPSQSQPWPAAGTT